MQVVAIDIYASPPEEFQSWWRDFGAADVLFAQDVDLAATEAYGVYALGTKVFIDREGHVAHMSAGTAGYENLRRWLEEII